MRAALALLLALFLLLPPSAHAQEAEGARFAPCNSGPRITCVVDGDTFWLNGTKIRIADINTPETSRPACPYEAELGRRATGRLLDLLNSGPFTLSRSGRDEDRYGRKLRVVMRGGQSLGEVLITEGLAEQWQGRRRNWCGANPS
ncbi:MAG: thermonuclease family protein [Sphingomonadaceae bacterium]|nr:thermonuclease family protein [Sphingomonadaceae bacterium]